MESKKQGPAAGDPLFPALLRAISLDRLEPFLAEAGDDPARALRLYLWNAALAEAFYLPLQAAEITLRNRINEGLADLYGADWWQHPEVKAALQTDRKTDLETVQRRLHKLREPVTSTAMVAGLSLGFWVSMLHSRYNKLLWNGHLRTIFNELPDGVGRAHLAEEAVHIQRLRNRISHHDPIFARDLSGDFSRVMRFLGWLSPAKAIWIRPHCRIPALLRQKP